MKVIIKDGSELEVKSGVSVLDVAGAISEGLARNAVAGKIDGTLVDLGAKVKARQRVDIITLKDKEGYDVYRHSTAHVMAAAVTKLYPDAKFAIGPSIENGFYYDFDVQNAIKKEDLAKIEAEMQNIIKADLPFIREEITLAEAKKIFKNEPFKLELLAEIPAGQAITVYKLGDFCDLCRGPHLISSGLIKAYKLQSVTGAYWRGDEKNPMLTRIYGTAFSKKSELDEYLLRLEEAKARDHNKIGRELGYFTTDELVGQGLPLIMPNGAKVLQMLERFVEDKAESCGYKLTKTPTLAKSDLYKVSGHWDHYKDKMVIAGNEEKDDKVYALRPMTCPFQFLIYKNELKSYKDLPAKYYETSKLVRKESSGEMHGLVRLLEFTLSDAHVILREDQLTNEFKKVMELVFFFLDKLGIKEDLAYLRLSKWDGGKNNVKYINNPEGWMKSEQILRDTMTALKIPFVEADDEAAFYGPKIDFQMKNVYGKEDSVFTVQIDFALAERWDLTYIDEKGEKVRPWIIHHSCVGCYERTLAFLIEKFNGALPFWYSPVQVKVLSLTDRTANQASEMAEKLRARGIRAEADNRSEKIGYKIREAQLNKIPYMLIIGDDEAKAGTVAVRERKQGDIGAMKADAFIEMVVKQNQEKIIK